MDKKEQNCDPNEKRDRQGGYDQILTYQKSWYKTVNGPNRKTPRGTGNFEKGVQYPCRLAVDACGSNTENP